MKALKYDQGKPRMDLLDPYAMEQLSHVLTFGAQNPLELRQWLQHQYEELLDAAVYCRRAIQEIDNA